MSEKTRKIGTCVLALVNLAAGFYMGFAYIAFTRNAAIESGADLDLTTMQGGGDVGSFSRYLAISILALILHAFLAVFNLSVMAHLAPDARRGNTVCGFVFVAGFLATVGTAALLSFLQR